MKRMTKGELHVISKRVDEINVAIELCDPDWDADVLDNLQDELTQIIGMLEASIGLAKQDERKGA